MSAEKDTYTFQYGELKRGQVYALAMAKVTENFLRANFHDSPNYEKLLLSVSGHLTRDPSMDDKLLHGFELALMTRQNAVLKEERDNDKDRKKFVFENRAKGRDVNDDSESEAEEEGLTTEEQLAERKRQQEEEEKRKEAEFLEAQERFQAMLRRKEENEARLKSQARKVDTAAIERQLESRGAVLLNEGLGAKKRSGKGSPKPGQLSAEEAAKMKVDVALVMKEKTRLDTVLHTSDEELPAALAEAKKSLAEYTQKTATLGEPASPTKEMSKGEVTQLQQKLTKQTMDKNRLAMQLKAMEPNPVRDELVAVLEQRDVLAVKVEQAENA
ncbi:hypothetical protein ABB37_02762 [Leptomonas pyrrhocoris]|uniref:Uncharacterized protein n=1 Tax=Leptomonas pyrrhocoris TaxID=157538 RepID=A0A0M9G667_LEPPY|nr:hypothetical protein ABB37_02762 [Leptomonas pyrrhocoris]KPA83036.1 hypothetical protein ABB37_02762 [Leptomonas pyrrhocoris]|eukprot:XP_015661475.1 hypothetical protein ABB37_02762 [Leptomonas pyrrhocoris]